MNDALPELVAMARLRQRFDDDEELLAEIFKVFVMETPERRADIKASLAAGDLPRLTRLAHSLKGVAGTIFAEPLRQAAYDLELAARAGTPEPLPGLVTRLLDLLEETTVFLRPLA